MIFTKSTFSKKRRKIIDFGAVFGGQNDEKSRKNGVEKRVFFLLRFFCDFLRIFAILGRFWEASGPQKMAKILKKSIFFDFLTRSVLKEVSGRALGRFWEGFGMVLGQFWDDF